MFFQKSFIYIFAISFASAPLFANAPSNKSSLSPEDIEKIADRVVEKVQNQQEDPKHRAKMIQAHIAFQSDPEITKFRREQIIKEQSSPEVQEFRRHQMQKDLKTNPLINTIVPIHTIIITSAVSLVVGMIIGAYIK